jgi:hypothetical protein
MIEGSPTAHKKAPSLEQLPTVDPLEKAVYEIISHAPEISYVNKDDAPFKNFSDNNQKSWHHIPPEEADVYLNKKLFFETRKIDYDDMTEIFEIDKKYDEPGIKIPLDLVVCAAGFENWKGRDKSVGKSWSSEYGYGETKSNEVIKHYAGLPTKLPSVTAMRMFKQPDGKVFFDNGSGDPIELQQLFLEEIMILKRDI